MRIVNGELENLVFEPRKEFITMQVLVIGNIPLLYWLNQDWYDVLMHTPLGQALLAAIAAVMFISTAAVIKLTQPIEYRRGSSSVTRKRAILLPQRSTMVPIFRRPSM